MVVLGKGSVKTLPTVQIFVNFYFKI